jgi:serine/threonine protein kinase
VKHLEYATPETLLEGRFGMKIDIWDLGLVLYELVHGHSPFHSESLEETVENITKGAPLFSTEISANLLNLLSSLLAKNPLERPEINEIFVDPWILQNLRGYDLSFLNDPKFQSNAKSLSRLFQIVGSSKTNPIAAGINHNKNFKLKTLPNEWEQCSHALENQVKFLVLH